MRGTKHNIKIGNKKSARLHMRGSLHRAMSERSSQQERRKIGHFSSTPCTTGVREEKKAPLDRRAGAYAESFNG